MTCHAEVLVVGDTFRVRWRHLDTSGSSIDLTGYSATLTMRDADGNELLTVDTDGDPGERLVIDGPAGTVTADVGPSQTGALPPASDHTYAIEVVSPGGTRTTAPADRRLIVLEDQVSS